MDETHAYTYTFNSAGRLIREVYEADADGDGIADETERTEFQYDSRGNVDLEIREVPDRWGMLQTYRSTYTYNYDASGSVVSRKIIVQTENWYDFYFYVEYDSDGRLVRDEHYRRDPSSGELLEPPETDNSYTYGGFMYVCR